jgi:hypothetical protein
MEDAKMFTKLSLAAGVVAMAAMLAPIGAPAAPAMPQTRIVDMDGGALVQKAQWGYGYGYRHCRYWRHECANRWGWRTPRFFRCLARHGC